jgi:hypothetical protein
VSSPVARYRPSRRYAIYAVLCSAGAAGSAWAAAHWSFGWIAAVISSLAAAFAMLTFSMRPAIEVHNAYLAVGRHILFWDEIRRVDRTRWTSPLVVRLTLAGGKRLLALYPGDADSSMMLLRDLFQRSRYALLDGVPHDQFWGEASRPEPVAQGRLLLPEDEAEVERLFRRLKTAGRLDPRGSGDE